MTKIIFLLFIFSTLQSISQKLKVELEFKYVQPNCNGTESKQGTDEISKKEKPLANCKLYLYLKNKCIDTVKTNESGTVIVKLLPGKYFLYEAWKHFKRTPDGSSINDFFKDCMVKEWLKPNYILTISEGDLRMDYSDVSASRCPNQYSCLKVRHLPTEIKRK